MEREKLKRMSPEEQQKYEEKKQKREFKKTKSKMIKISKN